MIVKWRTEGWSPALIERVEIERETDKMIFILNRAGLEVRSVKIGTHQRYFDSWGEARDYLLMRSQSNLELARTNLARAQDKIGNIKGLKEPGK